jgi:hypothetical protein
MTLVYFQITVDRVCELKPMKQFPQCKMECLFGIILGFLLV